MAKNFTSKNDKIFTCEKCNFVSVKKGDYNRHLLTLKHKRLTVLHPLHQSMSCENCGKVYKHHSSLCKHRKKCLSLDSISDEPSTAQPEISGLLSRNNELMEKLIEVSGEKTTNNFNLNVFLNETCKDALNMSDFVASLRIQLSDLNHLKDSSYSEGLSSIIVKELRDIDVSKRPLHCCDSRKEIIYIKDQDVWAPDNENNDKMKSAIQMVANKCVQNIKTWEQDNPNYLESGTKDNDDYCVLVKNSLGSSEARIKERELNRVVRTVSTQIQLDGNKIDSV